MQKFLFIHFLNTKQKENHQTPSKSLNITLSVIIMLIALIFTGKQMLGFLIAKPINGIDLLEVLLLIYGTLNLIYSYTFDYEVPPEKIKVMAMREKNSEIVLAKKSNKELNILPMIKYDNYDVSKKENPLQAPNLTTEQKEKILIPPTVIEKEEINNNPIEVTPDEILLEQLYDMEQNFHIYEECEQIDENALPLSSSDNEPIRNTKKNKEEKLTNFLTDLL